MTKFVPKEIKGNVNVVKDHPLKVFFKAMIGLGVLLFVSFTIFVSIAEIAISILPNRINHSLGKVYQGYAKTPDHLQADRERIQKLLDEILVGSGLEDLSFRAEIIESEFKNAMAVPGGYIVFTTALLEELETEQELAFILGHELGHYRNSDHLRSLSRSVIVGALLGIVGTAGAGEAGRFAATSLNIFNLQYSREQEQAADEFGLEMSQRHYGYVAGAISAIQRFYKEGEALKTAKGFLSTHPITVYRIEHMKEVIGSKGYSRPGPDALIPFSFTVPEEKDNVASETVD